MLPDSFVDDSQSMLHCQTFSQFYYGLPYKDQIEDLFTVMVSASVFPTPNLFNFLINFNF